MILEFAISYLLFIRAWLAAGWESLGSPWANCVLAEVPKVIWCQWGYSSSWLGILIDSNQQWLAISWLCLRSEVVNCGITQELYKYNCSGIGPGCSSPSSLLFLVVSLPLALLPSHFLSLLMCSNGWEPLVFISVVVSHLAGFFILLL